MKINKYLQLCFTSMGCHMLFSMLQEKWQSSKSLFQFTTIKMMIFCARKNLLNNKKSLKGYQNCCVKKPWKNFGGRKPSWKLTLKSIWYHSCDCSDDSRSCGQLKKCVTDKSFEKKLDFEPESPFITGKVCYHYNSWVTGVYVWQKFRKKSILNWVIIWRWK